MNKMNKEFTKKHKGIIHISKQWSARDIVALRSRFDLSQRELAVLCGCRQQTVSEWEVEKYRPNIYRRILSDVEKHLEKNGK